MLVLAAAACDDPNSGIFDPLIQVDTVDLAIPLVDPAVPTALDVAYADSPLRGRFPELVSHAEHWDVTLRREGGNLVMVPAGVLGFRNPVGGGSTAAVSRPMQRGFDEVIEAPSSGLLLIDSTVTVTLGDVYVVRSRRTAAGFGGCENYAKVQPLAATEG
jgi:hypothetical protein